MARRNFIGLAMGPRGSGKTHLLARYASLFPRRVTFDTTGERLEQHPNAPHCYNAAAVFDALEDVATLPRWHIIAAVPPAAARAVLAVLAPPELGDGRGFSAAVGGVCIELPEMDHHLRNGRLDDVMLGVFLRGRHYGVSVLGDTQRPQLVDRIVTSQADVLCVFRQHEPLELKYFAGVMGSHAARLIPTLADFHHLRYFPNGARLELVRPDGRARVVPAPGE